MVDAVTSTTLINTGKTLVMRFTNVSDATGEAAALKVDVSTFTNPMNGKVGTGVSIQRIWFSTVGMSVNLLWDASTDVLAFGLPADITDTLDFREVGGLINNAGSGKTGDVLLTTTGHTAGDTYTIILEMTIGYDS